jgi:hypothetical protein
MMNFEVAVLGVRFVAGIKGLLALHSPFCLLYSVLSSLCATSFFLFYFFSLFSLIWYTVLAIIMAEFS